MAVTGKKFGNLSKVKAEAKKEKAERAEAKESKRIVGTKSGLGITATWNKYLEANAKKKLTDEQLYDAMMEEFPGKEKMQPVARVRSWYNTGRYGFGKGPDVRLEDDDRSVAYGEDGEIRRRAKAEVEEVEEKPAKKEKAKTKKAKSKDE